MTLTRRTLGTHRPAQRLRPRPRLHGHAEFYGTADEAEAIATIHRALDLGVTFLDTADMYGPSPTSSWSARRSRTGATRSQLATKFGNERGPDGSWVGIDGSPGVRPAGVRRLAAATRRRPHRPLLPAPRRPDRADRGDRRRDGRARRGRQGRGTSASPRPPPRRSAARTPCTRSPRCRASTRCSPATSRTRSCRPCASSASAWCPTRPLGRGLLTGAITSAAALGEDDSRALGVLPPLPGRGPRREPRAWSPGPRDRRGKGCTPGSSRSPGCSRRATTSPRSPAPSGSPTSRRTSAPPRSTSATTSTPSSEAVPREAVAGTRYGDMSSIDD